VRRSARRGLIILAPFFFFVGGAGETVATAARQAVPSGTGVLVRQQLKPASGQVGGSHFGSAIAMAGDGKTLLVGAPGGGHSGGTVWVFSRTATGWSQHGRLSAGAGSPACFGASVALSFDGSTALVGDACLDGMRGAVWTFARSGSVWKPIGGRLAGAAERGAADFGTSVALSDNGKVALIGGPGDDRNAGAAWVFARKGSRWAEVGPKLRGGSEQGAGELGLSVALSGDGTTALVGGPSDDDSKGAAWAFVRSGAGFAEQGRKLTAKGGAQNDEFGWSVALSGSGDMALIGSPSAGAWGQAMIFARESGAWSERERLALDGKGDAGLTGGYGVSVALSAAGTAALVGSGLHNTNAAAATLLTRSGGTWRSRGLTLASSRAINAVNVAFSSGGTTPVVASPTAYSNAGAVWAFSFLNVAPPTFSPTPQRPGKRSRTSPLAA
jgi:hypothetical protein